jgi:hypothetical protein
MSRKKVSTTLPEKGEVPFGNIQWVLNNLSKSELEDYDKRDIKAADLVSWVQRMIETGWRQSIKWDDKSSAVQVTFIQARYEYPNAGFAFSARSDDWLDAVGICWYKYDVIAKGMLSEFSVEVEHVRG